MKAQEIIERNKTFIDETWKKLDKKLSRTAVKSRYKIPYTTKNGQHDDKKDSIEWWTNGFWGGLMWLMYDATGNQEYRVTAEQNEAYLEAAFQEVEKLHHDVGFMWHLTSGANYRLTGSAKSKNRAMLAAMLLASRYNVDGGYIRAWNGDTNGWTIIDSMMNLPLLYWASEEIGDARFRKIAIRHADMTMRDHIRENGMVNHIVAHAIDEEGIVLDVYAGQGYSNTSCWSRGAAWALYGFTLSYMHTKEERYLDTAIKVANCFIQEVKKTDWLTRLDFCQPSEPLYYDSTAGAIAACGLMELSNFVEEEGKAKFLSAALNILKAMETQWCDWGESEDSILQMGSEAYTQGIHMPIIYGDMFFAEAILKLKGVNFLIW